jgi:hypothetical protein
VGVPAILDISITNNNSAACAPATFDFVANPDTPGITLDPPAFTRATTPPVASGATVHVTVTATPDEGTEGALLVFLVFVFDTASQVIADGADFLLEVGGPR